jgi:acetyl esterase
VEGQQLDPELRLVRLVQNLLPGVHRHSAPFARRRMARAQRLVALPPCPLHEVRDLAGPVPLRLYRPRPESRAALLYLHGGGYVVGSIETHDSICRLLAAESGRVILSADYGLAPERPFPGAVEDCLAAWGWLLAEAEGLGLDPGRIGAGGDSAGGTLATVIAQQHTQAPERLLLIYPGFEVQALSLSRRSLNRGLVLDQDMLDWFLHHYLGGRHQEDPRASPARGPLHRMPPTDIITAGLDPLRDEAEEVAEQLRSLGIPVRLTRCDGLLHGFLQMAGISTRSEAAARQIGALLAGPPPG